MPVMIARKLVQGITGVALVLVPLLAQAQAPVSYADVAPLFASRCVMCHTGDAAPLGLRLDSLAAIQAGSSKGPVVKAGESGASELIRRLSGASQPRMPLTGPPWLDPAEVERIAAWIDAGLPAGAEVASAPVLPAAPAEGETVTYAHVEAIFMQRCVKCHKVDGVMGAPPEGLQLLTYQDLLAGNDRVVVVPGNPAASHLLRRIKGYGSPRMPFDGPPWLSAGETRLIERWIADGARDRSGQMAPMPVGREVRLDGRLGPNGQLDDFTIEIDAGTRVKKAPGAGDEVRVRGRVQADGSLRVTRIQRR